MRKNLNNKIKNEFYSIAPSNFDKIISKIEKKEGNILKMEKKETKTNDLLFKCAITTCILVICALFGYEMYKTNKVESVIAIDVNPSIEINVNAAHKVISAIAKNDDGKKILENINVKGKEYEAAVNKIMKAIINAGYIDKRRNAVLVTVINDSTIKSEMIRINVINDITKSLKEEKISITLLSQTANTEDTKNINSNADKNKISIGKAIYLNKVINNNKNYNFKDLAKLTIGELNKISKATNENVNVVVNNISNNINVTDDNTNVNVNTNENNTNVNVDNDNTNVNVNTNKNNTNVKVKDNNTNVNVNTGTNGTGVTVGDNDTSVGVNANQDNIEVNVNDKDFLSETAVKVIVAATSKSVSVDGYNVTLDKDNNQYIVTFKTKKGITMQYTLDAKTGMITNIKTA